MRFLREWGYWLSLILWFVLGVAIAMMTTRAWAVDGYRAENTFYVDQIAGSDSNEGHTPELAKATWDALFSTVAGRLGEVIVAGPGPVVVYVIGDLWTWSGPENYPGNGTVMRSAVKLVGTGGSRLYTITPEIWTTGRTYSYGDIVRHANKKYQCNVWHVASGAAPGTSFTKTNDHCGDDWVASTSYITGDIVKYGTPYWVLRNPNSDATWTAAHWAGDNGLACTLSLGTSANIGCHGIEVTGFNIVHETGNGVDMCSVRNAWVHHNTFAGGAAGSGFVAAGAAIAFSAAVESLAEDNVILSDSQATGVGFYLTATRCVSRRNVVCNTSLFTYFYSALDCASYENHYFHYLGTPTDVVKFASGATRCSSVNDSFDAGPFPCPSQTTGYLNSVRWGAPMFRLDAIDSSTVTGAHPISATIGDMVAGAEYDNAAQTLYVNGSLRVNGANATATAWTAVLYAYNGGTAVKDLGAGTVDGTTKVASWAGTAVSLANRRLYYVIVSCSYGGQTYTRTLQLSRSRAVIIAE